PTEDADRDTFSDRPRKELPNHLLGKEVECSMAMFLSPRSRVEQLSSP
ncbi:unnamed protein product, partial [Rhizoctonia solani]